MNLDNIRIALLRIFLSPFAVLYGIVVEIRNLLYQMGVLKGVKFDIPIISVGNLTVGGSGKTPHIEYLIRYLQMYINVATLSRGYKRKTSGFIAVLPHHTAEKVGDEPLQFKRKFPEVAVAVGESRVLAVPQLLACYPETQLVLLDDAFQHRSIIPLMNILLTEYQQPFTRDYLLPVGRLREWRAGYQRADVIVVTKCPIEMGNEEKDALIQELAPHPHQRVYFSYYEYQALHYIFNNHRFFEAQKTWNVVLLCGIANADYLIDYLERQVNEVRLMEFTDHHQYSNYDMGRLQRLYQEWNVPNKMIITTEKDAMRLEAHKDFIVKMELPILVLPIEVAFHSSQYGDLVEDVKHVLLDFKV